MTRALSYAILLVAALLCLAVIGLTLRDTVIRIENRASDFSMPSVYAPPFYDI